jgi:hypothetical protein
MTPCPANPKTDRTAHPIGTARHAPFSHLFVFSFRRPAMFKTTSPNRPSRPLALLALAAALVAPSAFAFDSGSTGADGALAPTVNTQITLPPSGILNYTTVNIPTGVTVTFRKNALNTPVYLLASGNVTIAGAINISGATAADTGTAGDGNQADDGLPGAGGPGGFDGGRGGKDDQAQNVSVIRGGAGLGPGGGLGGIEGANGCGSDNRYYRYVGVSAGYASISQDGISSGWWGEGYAWCSSVATVNVNGKAYGSAILQPLIGGSGGGGGRGGTNYPGSGGGGGGGALLIASSGTVTLTGSISANGGYGGLIAGTGAVGPGGAGSGGAVRIVATRVAGNGSISTQYACPQGTAIYNEVSCTYYRSSQGRIRIEGESITYTGSTTPTYVADVPGPIFLASLPSLRIDTVAGVAVPANPTGSADVVLPATQANPVTITFASTNVPPGNTVLFKLIPAYGTPTEVLSPAITGTTASGSTSVQVSLPQGPSTLQATTTYTVVVAMGDALSQFAQNERVEKVQLSATLGGADSQVKLITVSGKEYVVPATVLQLVGFAS